MDRKNHLVPDSKMLLARTEKSSISAAEHEAESMSEEALDRVAKIDDHNHKSQARKTFHWFNMILIWIVYFIIYGSIFILVYHVILPESYHFTSKESLSTIKESIFVTLASKSFIDFRKENIGK